MGSGASKVNSDGSDITTENQVSGQPNRSEKNSNNFIAKPTSPTSLQSEPNVKQRIQERRSDTTQPSKGKKTLPPLQTHKPIDFSTKTAVVSLKTNDIESNVKENEKESGTIKRLNKELAESESQKLDLLDQIQLLTDHNAIKEQNTKQQTVQFSNPDSLQETLNAKDQYILKLDREAKTNQTEANKLRIKLKKRIKGLTNQLHEVRQESSINQMELKAEIARQAEEIKSLRAGILPSCLSGEEGGQEHSKIIVELSNQLSEQAEQISSLEAELSEKKKEISDLKVTISSHFDSQDALSAHTKSTNSLLPQTSTDRLHSSRGKRVTQTHDRPHESNTQNSNDSVDTSSTLFQSKNTKNVPQTLERQSTALSDSDSDWGENTDVTAPSHIHSAPARSRVKSAVSFASSGHHKGSLLTLNGNDDSIMDLVSASPINPLSGHRADSSIRSTLKSHLEKARVESQSNSLIGPTLAFEKKADSFSDTSCEPTPRTQRTMLYNNSKIRIVKPIVR